MSKGIGVRAELLSQDDDKIIYCYGPFNWNRPECYNKDYEMDGRVTIWRIVLPIIEFHNRNSRKTTKKHGMIKRVEEKYTLEEMLEKQYVTIQNSKYSWMINNDEGLDVMALRVVTRSISEYAKTGVIPEKIFFLS